MQDFLDSFWEWFKEKTTSPLYATYAFCFVVHNWQIFFTLFFQDNDQLDVPKIEYVQQHFFYKPGAWVLIDYADALLIPALLTFGIIRYLPRVITWAHKLNVKHYFERKRIYETELLAFEKEKNTGLKKLVNVKSEQASAIKKIENLIPEKQVWEKEFGELGDKLNQVHFNEAIRTIYENQGWVHQMPSGFIAFADVHGLIEFNEDRGKIFLTPKGKLFAKKFISRNR